MEMKVEGIGKMAALVCKRVSQNAFQNQLNLGMKFKDIPISLLFLVINDS